MIGKSIKSQIFIHKHTNAVIILSTDEYGVYVGVPARKIKSRK